MLPSSRAARALHAAVSPEADACGVGGSDPGGASVSNGRGAPSDAPTRPAGRTRSAVQAVERLLEAAGMALLGLRQGLEPLGDLLEALLAGGARHAGIHVGV